LGKVAGIRSEAPDVRPLTDVEKRVVRWFAEHVGESQRRSLLSDLDQSSAEEIHDEHLTIRFHIDGYPRPSYRGERPLPVDATVSDADGVRLAVILAADEDERLFELQVLRFEPGPVLGPNWATLGLCAPGEVINLGTYSTEAQSLASRVRDKLLGYALGKKAPR
jgi:hypothetical protein